MNNEQFIFSNYYLILKKYTNKRYSDEILINALLGIIIETFQILGTCKSTLYYEKAECSKLRNRKLDISKNIRLYLNNDNIENEILEETIIFLNKYINSNFKSKIINEISNLYKNDISISQENCFRLDKYKDNFELFISATLIEVLKYNNLKKISKTKIFEKGNTLINICIGDILDNNFIKCIEKNSSIVIPVDRSFDVKVCKPNDTIPIYQINHFMVNGLIRCY